jgi:DNA-binding response OmpR family regulator
MPQNYGGAMQATATVLVYSDNARTREQVRLATGRRPATDVPLVEFVECATLPAVLKEMNQGGIDVCVLDGEAAPAGGMGICRQLKDEVFRCPPVLLLIGRPQDAWLATWSRADAAVTLPVEPVEFADALAGLLRGRLAVEA